MALWCKCINKPPFKDAVCTWILQRELRFKQAQPSLLCSFAIEKSHNYAPLIDRPDGFSKNHWGREALIDQKWAGGGLKPNSRLWHFQEIFQSEIPLFGTWSTDIFVVTNEVKLHLHCELFGHVTHTAVYLTVCLTNRGTLAIILALFQLWLNGKWTQWIKFGKPSFWISEMRGINYSISLQGVSRLTDRAAVGLVISLVITNNHWRQQLL